MRVSEFCRLGVFLLLTLVATGCGGGGAVVPPPGPPTLLATLKAVLLGSLETSVFDAHAQGTAVIDLLSDGTLSFACTAEPAWVSDILGAHIHRGAPGVDGPIVVDLLGGGAAFDGGTLTASDTLAISTALAAEIAATPADFYVNVHTGAAPAGFVRQQLAPLAPMEIHATLRGSAEVVVADASARGGVTLHLAADKSVSYRLGMASPAIADVTSAHIHAAPAGVDGGILIDLDPAGATLNPVTDLLEGAVTPTLVQLARIGNDLAGFYVNVHTATAPAGVARGQLSDQPVEFWSRLEAANETTPPSDMSARGGAALRFDSFNGGVAHLAVPLAQGIGSVVMAHVHEAPAGVDGPVVIDLQAGADYLQSPLSFSAEGSITCDQDLFTRMLADPAGFYVNFHSVLDPGGAARGQLSQDSVGLFAALDGDEEVPVFDGTASGTAQIVLRSMFDCTFTLNIGNPTAAEITAAHVHDGDAGANGPVLIDLLGGTDIVVSGTFITGSTTFSGRTLSRLLAASERFYVNVHSVPAPAGIARGQLAIRDESTPPSGLSYATPVSYTEGVAIPNNVPTSGGGAVAGYSISPGLPPGLVIDPHIGVISGSPTSTSAAADYTVTATNASGSTTATVNIEVLTAPPTNLQYATPVSYPTGSAITPNAPTNDGGAITSYAISQALPAGLAFSTSTGVISGTPTSASTATNYTITGTNAAGSATKVVNLAVTLTLQPPSSLSYTSPVTYSTGTAITDNTPTVSGGAVASWSISTALPSGLSFSTTTGVISGTPSAISSATNYTVTATNAAGSTTAVVNVTVTLGAPTNLTYSNNPGIGYINVPLATMQPSSQGGAVTSYSISPALPSGLNFNTSTGDISGTPTTTSNSTTYTITATNSAGSTTGTVDIIVY